MAFSTIIRTYYPSDFSGLATFPPGATALELLKTKLAQLPSLTVPVSDVRLAPLDAAVVVEFGGVPSEADFDAVDSEIDGFVGATTETTHQETQSFAASTTTAATFTSKIDETTPPLAGGTWMVNWQSTLRMSVVGANSGVLGRMRIERSDGQFLEQTDSWDLSVGKAYNGCVSFPVSEGQTLQCTLSFARIGANGTAEMSGARVAIDRVGF